MTRQANALLVIAVTFLLAHFSRFGYTRLDNHYLIALLIVILVASIILPATGAFRRDFEWAVFRRLRRLIAGWAIVLLALISLAAMLKTTDLFSRIWFGLWVMYGTVGLSLVVLFSHAVALRKRKNKKDLRRIALVGSGNAASRVERRIDLDPASDMQVAGRFGRPWSEDEVMPLGQLAGYLEAHGIQEVWIAADWDDKHLLPDSLDVLKESVVDVSVVPDFDHYRLLNQSITEWAGMPVVNLSGTPMTDTELKIKGLADWVGALVLVIVLSPLLLGLALAIRVTSKGPVLFRQERHGLGGEAIQILKFRSMVAHTEPEGQVTQASRSDKRVTGIGRFMRATSLDELPQLFNVLKFEMSLVGPRPHAVQHNAEFKSKIPRYMLRHRVKPGMTGWAQVNGLRGQTETPEKMALRIEHDLWYIQNWSLWLDLRILLMTPFAMFHKNAY